MTNVFTDFGHYRNEGYLFRVEEPVVRDITEEVAAWRRHQPRSSPIPETTRYFGFFHPDIEIDFSSMYVYGGLDAAHSQRLEQQERGHGQFDKVAQRELCEKIGIFRNVGYLDIRKLFSESNDPVTVEFAPKAYSGFPREDILETLGQGRSYIFENTDGGFRLRTSKRGITVMSNNDLVNRVDAATRHIRDPGELIDSFLAGLSDAGYTFKKVGYRRDGDYEGRERLIAGILEHPENLYIKSARTGGGYLVIRIRKDGGENIVESDSEQFAWLVDKFVSWNDQRMARRQQVLSDRHQSPRHEMIARLREEIGSTMEPLQDPREPQVLLNLILSGASIPNVITRPGGWMPNPLIEAEIPYEKVDGRRVEFRMICQQPGRKMDITGYTKVSESDINANISLGGVGARILPLYRAMFEKHENVSDAALDELAEAAERSLFRDTRRFARAVQRYYVEREGKAPADFAIDIVPSWNGEGIDHYFLEINYRYGFKGLIDADPAGAQRVRANKVWFAERLTVG
ncbi:MAG: hypothetical protein ABH879_00080 [archaeon]